MTTSDLRTALYIDEDFERALSEDMTRAAAEGLPYCVVACVPQRLPGEDVSNTVPSVAKASRSVVREADLAGLLGGEIMAVGLPDTGPADAQIVAYRLQGELGLRSARVRTTVWEAGIACLPDDGRLSDQLLGAAIDAARTHRRRLGQ